MSGWAVVSTSYAALSLAGGLLALLLIPVLFAVRMRPPPESATAASA
ncbi:hypothetical protein [Nocardioides sp.]|nr:hypothetical protein [Nocardioides sp.]HXH78755.1 hypothetical protein [Nocardioides sp.]